MEMEVDGDDLPEFFKVFISHHSSEKMLIPSDFVDYLGDMTSGPAKLVGPSGKTWRVELVEDGKDLFFIDGWKDFLEDNMIQDGEFLFFKFHGNLTFSVVVYDESMCERGAGFIDKRSQGRYGKLGAGEELNGIRPVKRESAKLSQPGGPFFPSGGKIAERSAISVKPFFEKRITASNITFSFNLPSSFVQEHSLTYKKINETMVLRTSKKSSWEVSIINRCGKITLSRGWPAFVRENSIRIGDVCKFELVDRLEMMVSVVHWKDGICKTNINGETLDTGSLKRTVGVSQPGLSRGSPFITGSKKAAARTMPSSLKPSLVLDMKKYNVERHRLTIPARFTQGNSLRYQSNEQMILRTKKGSSWPVNIIRANYKTSSSTYHFCGGWAKFVHDNNIKEGDTCEFELLNRLEMKVHHRPSKKSSHK